MSAGRHITAEVMVAQHMDVLRHTPLFKNRSTSITELKGGITNKNYVVESGVDRYVARFAFPFNKLLGINRKVEVRNTRTAAELGIGPYPIAHLPKHKLLIVRYIEGAVFDKTEIWAEDILSVAHVLGKLHHCGPIFSGTRDVFKDIETYAVCVFAKNGWTPDTLGVYLRRLRAIKKLLGTCPKTACHFDLMLGNIVKTPEGNVKLIDWEYSANGDPRFDIAMFALKASLTSSYEEELVYKHNCTWKLRGLFITVEEIRLMKMVVCLREASWGMLQNAISPMRHEFDYKEYATKHLALFDTFMNELPLSYKEQLQ
ncbi:MAG: phosphotransferase [Parcubacteria group bacterium]|nr:phosphotransferase [Parcubacteria group bacterium]